MDATDKIRDERFGTHTLKIRAGSDRNPAAARCPAFPERELRLTDQASLARHNHNVPGGSTHNKSRE